MVLVQLTSFESLRFCFQAFGSCICSFQCLGSELFCLLFLTMYFSLCLCRYFDFRFDIFFKSYTEKRNLIQSLGNYGDKNVSDDYPVPLKFRARVLDALPSGLIAFKIPSNENASIGGSSTLRVSSSYRRKPSCHQHGSRKRMTGA